MIKILNLFIFLSIVSCTSKFDITEVPIPDDNFGNFTDTIYVKQNPQWGGFNKPQDMIIGREPFIYVADTENDRIVMLNISGEFLGEKAVKKPIALSQDYSLNLIVCAQFDTNSTTYSAVYKIDLFNSGHILENAPLKRILPQTPQDFSRNDRIYTGAAVFSDNMFYISRTGPINSSPVDPDNSILQFEKKIRYDGLVIDTLIGRIPNIEPEGSGLVSANIISSLTSFNRNNIDIIVTLIGSNSFKVQWLQYVVTPLDSKYQSVLSPLSSDLMTIDKFGKPEDADIDEYGNIYVADSEKDSIYKFNSFGDELESFGGREFFNSPHSVAVFDNTLYVLDTNNDRIVRFILSTDL